MKKLILLAILVAIAWQGYTKFQGQRVALAGSESAMGTESARRSDALRPAPEALASPRFICDGRSYCSQMTSCQEATYFLHNCPGVKMDGDHDGIPCERQWCQ